MSDYQDSSPDLSTHKDYATILSRKIQRAVKQKFDDACMLCGYPVTELLNVAPILARRNVRHVRTLLSAKLATVLHSKPDLFRSKHYDRGRPSSHTFAPFKTIISSGVR